MERQTESFEIEGEMKGRDNRALISTSALTGLEARCALIDDVNAALAANQLVLAVTCLQRLKRIFDLHGRARFLMP